MDILHFMARYLSFPTSQSHFLVLGCFLQSRENHPDAELPDGAQNRQKKLYLSTRFGQWRQWRWDEKKILKALQKWQQIRRIIAKLLRDHIHETSSCLEVDIAGRVWVLISPMASSSCHHDDPTVPCHTILDLILLFWSWFMIYTKVGNRYLSDVPILTRMMIIGWGFLQSIGQRLKESKIPIIKFLTVPCKVHLVGKWDNGQKRRRRSLQRKSLFTNDLIRKGLRRSSPTYF